MQVISKSDLYELNFSKGIGLGNFDGLHIGHMTLIDTLIKVSEDEKISSMVYTFTSHPENILRKKLITPLIITKNKKIDILKDTKLNYLYFEEFDENFSRINPENFIKDVLVEQLRAKLVVVGFDYRFGFKGKGDVNLLEMKSKEYKYKLKIIPPVRLVDNVISSTTIREKIRNGDMKSAFELIGRHFSLSGVVIHGRQMGRKLGFPTANILPDDYLVVPKFGVYITKSFVSGKYYNSVTNIGINPTFPNKGFSMETYIVDFDKDIYNTKIEVFFIERLRNELKFASMEELTNQMKIDIENAIKYQNNFRIQREG